MSFETATAPDISNVACGKRRFFGGKILLIGATAVQCTLYKIKLKIIINDE